MKSKGNKKILYVFGLLLFWTNMFSQIVINEIMVNPAGANDGANMPNTSEWIELYNPTSSAVNIGCWYFTDGDFAVKFPSGTTIPANGYYTIASASGSGLTPDLNWATCGCTTNNPGANGSLSGNQVGIFTNGSEQVLLYNSSNVIQDAIIWGGGQLTTALTLTVSALGVCGSNTVTIPSSTASYENIGTHTDGVAKERDSDGSATWQNTSTPTFGTANSAVVLDDDFNSFNIVSLDEYVELSWIGLQASYDEMYYIEKSFNGSDFNTSNIQVDFIDNRFSAIDGKSESTVYYRVKKISVNGYASYSAIFMLSPEKRTWFKIFPNPSTDGAINLIISEELGESTEINIIDVNGNVIFNGLGRIGINKLELGQQRGFFILYIKCKNVVEYAKFILE